MIKLKLIIISFLSFCLSNNAFTQSKELKVLQLNIWQEGTIIKNGYDAIVKEITALSPDIIMLSEVRNYNNTDFCDRLAKSLAANGKKYYTFKSSGSGILSAFPISENNKLFSEKGAVVRALTKVGKHEIAIYSAHLDYQNYAVHLPKGYSGTTWEKLPAPVLDVNKILADNLASKRDEAIDSFLVAAKEDIAKGRMIFLGGDFNEASHWDWAENTKDTFDHAGLVVPWQNSIQLYKNGFKDSFREIYPDARKNPGFTFPASNIDIGIEKLAWAPDADERERIDFIYFYPNKHLKLKSSNVVGPTGSILRNQRVEETEADLIIKPTGVWPTDHKAILSVFELK